MPMPPHLSWRANGPESRTLIIVFSLGALARASLTESLGLWRCHTNVRPDVTQPSFSA
jgi:hypothetical protein